MNIRRFVTAAICIAACALTGCKVTYSLSGASIPANAKTVSIPYFPNNATLVSPTLSSTLTDELQTRFTNQTKLELVPEITSYTVQPVAVTSNDMAAMNRLTITVKVKFTNRIDPTFDFNRSFSAFQEYPSSNDLSSVEGTLIPELVTQLVDDIFNAAVSNW